MARKIEADEGNWEVRLGRFPPHPGVGTVLFFPDNSQRPYRVAEVEAGRFRDQSALEALSDDELLALFGRAGVMDYVHEPKAGPTHEAIPVHTPSNVLDGDR